MSERTDRAATGTTRTRGSKVQAASALVGVAFLLVGTLGFIPGITTDYDTLEAAGHESNAMPAFANASPCWTT